MWRLNSFPSHSATSLGYLKCRITSMAFEKPGLLAIFLLMLPCLVLCSRTLWWEQSDLSWYLFIQVPGPKLEHEITSWYKKASSKLKLFSRMRPLLTRSATESVYKAVIVARILYCSTPALKIAKTDGRKFESLQNRAFKIIYGKQQKDCKSMSIKRNQKYKAYLLAFKCLKRTSIEVMNTCLEPFNHNQNTRNNKYATRRPRVSTEARKRPFGSRVQNFIMNFPAGFVS